MATSCALINNGVVVNFVAANDNELPNPNLVPLEGKGYVVVGATWDGSTFTNPPPPPPVVPAEVTMRQARLELLAIGKLSQVDAVIDSLPEPDRSAARIEWEYSNTVQRGNTFVLALGPALNVDLDELFINAAKR